MSLTRPGPGLCLGVLLTARLCWAADDAPPPGPPSTGGDDPAPPPVSLSSDSSCPDPAAVWSAVVGIVPRADLFRIAAGKVDITDMGDSYRVAIRAGDNESIHLYRDAERNCEHRARFAAVFAVLTLAPPNLLPAPASPPPPLAPRMTRLASAASPPLAAEASPTAPAPMPPARHFRMELSAVLDLAPAWRDAPPMTALGGELRALRGAGRLAAMASLGVEPRSSFELQGLTGKQLRIPFDLGLRWTAATWNRAAVAGDLGLAGAWFHAAGTNTAAPHSESRLDLGGRGGLVLRLGGSSTRCSAVLGLHALFFPRQYVISMTPQGEIGHTPALWLGATAGVSCSP